MWPASHWLSPSNTPCWLITWTYSIQLTKQLFANKVRFYIQAKSHVLTWVSGQAEERMFDKVQILRGVLVQECHSLFTQRCLDLFLLLQPSISGVGQLCQTDIHSYVVCKGQAVCCLYQSGAQRRKRVLKPEASMHLSLLNTGFPRPFLRQWQKCEWTEKTWRFTVSCL